MTPAHATKVVRLDPCGKRANSSLVKRLDHKLPNCYYYLNYVVVLVLVAILALVVVLVLIIYLMLVLLLILLMMMMVFTSMPTTLMTMMTMNIMMAWPPPLRPPTLPGGISSLLRLAALVPSQQPVPCGHDFDLVSFDGHRIPLVAG